MTSERVKSLWWILLPIFLGIIGGIIGYFVLKNDDLKLAKFCLHLSILLTIIEIIVWVPLVILTEQLTPNLGVNL
jgi:H+/Cl- antiporter ClcA